MIRLGAFHTTIQTGSSAIKASQQILFSATSAHRTDRADERDTSRSIMDGRAVIRRPAHGQRRNAKHG